MSGANGSSSRSDLKDNQSFFNNFTRMKKFTLLTAFLAFIIIAVNAQTITNVRFEQLGKLIDVYYDLEANESKTYTVTMFCSKDGGKTWGLPIKKGSGDVGDNVKPGTNKKVTWDVLKEQEKLVGEIMFKLEVVPESYIDNSGTVTDIDGNIYHTVTIGNQVWMKENLKTTKYKNATNIEYIGSDGLVWQLNTTGAYAWYNNDSTWKYTYGALYNWSAVNSAKGLCPAGWHVPSDAEWTILTTYLGGANIAGGKMKETSTLLWESPNTGATNKSGFTALPGGYQNIIGKCLSFNT